MDVAQSVMAPELTATLHLMWRVVFSATVPACKFGRREAAITQHPVSDLKQAPAHRNRQGMCPIVGTQLIHEIFDMKIDSGFRDCKSMRDLLVLIPIANELKYLQLAFGKVVVAKMLGNSGSHLQWNMPLARVDRADRSEQFISRNALEDVA